MRQLRISILALLLLLAFARPATAGGSLVEFPRGWAVVGSSVTASEVFGRGQQAAVREGPWFAYLQSNDGDRRPILLAPVSISDATGNVCCWRATLTFAVPPVEPGQYWVTVCDRGCTTGVGDLSGGPLYVAATERAGIAHEVRADARYRLRTAERRSSRQLASAEEESKSLRARWSAAAFENRALQTELATAASDFRDERDRVPAWVWLLIGAAAGAMSAGVVGARRRRRPLRSATERPAPARMDAGELVGSGRR